jgi:hypothetical protein
LKEPEARRLDLIIQKMANQRENHAFGSSSGDDDDRRR